MTWDDGPGKIFQYIFKGLGVGLVSFLFCLGVGWLVGLGFCLVLVVVFLRGTLIGYISSTGKIAVAGIPNQTYLSIAKIQLYPSPCIGDLQDK